MMEIWQRMVLYSAGGICTEVFFTACKNLYFNRDIMLNGYTQLWMVFVYSFGGLLFEFIHLYVDYNYRHIILLVLLYSIEYSVGWLLLLVIGKCPWEYSEWGNVHGLIQLVYIPFWMIFIILADIFIGIMMTYKLIKHTTQ